MSNPLEGVCTLLTAIGEAPEALDWREVDPRDVGDGGQGYAFVAQLPDREADVVLSQGGEGWVRLSIRDRHNYQRVQVAVSGVYTSLFHAAQRRAARQEEG